MNKNLNFSFCYFNAFSIHLTRFALRSRLNSRSVNPNLTYRDITEFLLGIIQIKSGMTTPYKLGEFDRH